MFLDELEFTWARPVGDSDYVWTDSKERGRVLVKTDDAQLVAYQPLNSSMALYREFALTPATEEGVLAFVNRYGWLGFGAQEVAQIESTPGVSRVKYVTVETMSKWQHFIHRVRQAVEIWDAVQKNDKETLAQRFRWEGKDGGVVRYYAAPWVGRKPWSEISDNERENMFGDDVIGDAPNGAALHRVIAKGDVITPAKLLVLYLLNFDLDRFIGPQLLLHSKRNKIVRQDRVMSLLGAIYLQFAQAILGQREPRPCQVCGRWFDVAPSENRKDRVFCSDPCKSKSYRDRKIQARRLAEEGKTATAIAKELDSTVATVKGWINSKRGSKQHGTTTTRTG